jgi:hypothetical protein
MSTMPKVMGMSSTDFFPYMKAANPITPNSNDPNSAAALGIRDRLLVHSKRLLAIRLHRGSASQ